MKRTKSISVRYRKLHLSTVFTRLLFLCRTLCIRLISSSDYYNYMCCSTVLCWSTVYHVARTGISSVGDELDTPLICLSARFEHITKVFHHLHFVDAAARQIEFKLAILAYKCVCGLVPSYFDEFHRSGDFKAQFASEISHVITDYLPCMTVYHWWPRFSHRWCSCMEQSSIARHLCTESTLSFRPWKTYLNMSTIATSLILSKKLIFIIICGFLYFVIAK